MRAHRKGAGGWRTLLLVLALGCSSKGAANPGVDAQHDGADAGRDQLPSCVCGASTVAISLGSCMFQASCAPGDFTRVSVKANGVALPRDQTHADGWDYTDAGMTVIRAFGSACTTVTNGGSVTIDQLCTGP